MCRLFLLPTKFCKFLFILQITIVGDSLISRVPVGRARSMFLALEPRVGPIDVEFKGVGGATLSGRNTPDWMGVIARKPDVIIIHCGGNDLSTGRFGDRQPTQVAEVVHSAREVINRLLNACPLAVVSRVSPAFSLNVFPDKGKWLAQYI